MIHHASADRSPGLELKLLHTILGIGGDIDVTPLRRLFTGLKRDYVLGKSDVPELELPDRVRAGDGIALFPRNRPISQG